MHVGHGIFDAHDIGTAGDDLAHDVGIDVVAGAVGEIVEHDVALDLAGDAAKVLDDPLMAELEVERGDDHHGIGAKIEGLTREADGLRDRVSARAHDELHPALGHRSRGLGEPSALLAREREELPVAAAEEYPVHAALDQLLPYPDIRVQIDLPLLVENRDDGNDEFRFLHLVHFPFAMRESLHEQADQADSDKPDDRDERAAQRPGLEGLPHG